MLVYIVFTVIGFYIYKQGNGLHKLLMGPSTKPLYFDNYPCQSLPKYLDDFFIIKFGYYFYECALVILFHRKRHDFAEFLFHHIMTLTLVSFGYYTNMTPLGVIMLIMDCSDIFVAIFKMTIDVNETTQVFSYIAMIISWFYLRLYFFPIYLIRECWIQAKVVDHPM